MCFCNATVYRIWEAHGLQPHQVEGFNLSKDRRFVEKFNGRGGVYLTRPTRPSCCAARR
jgi:hypothetical protein